MGAKVEAAKDGWKLAGLWQYSSGCLHADWAMLGAIVPEFDSPALLLVPRWTQTLSEIHQDRKCVDRIYR